jgi:cytoplasmic iron level regulating protein YaaA (DUF328/UPF0246 family)
VGERLLLLIPPSQGKAVGGRRSNKPGTFDDELKVRRGEVREAIMNFLATATQKQLEVTFSARGPLLERAIASMRAMSEEKVPLLAAWRRYEGVVWNHLNSETLDVRQRRQILVPSGFYGLLSSEDSIADYRLKMNASIKPLGTLATFWRPNLTTLLENRSKNRTIVNFLPQEHVASIDFSSLSKTREVIHLHFVAADETRAVGHDAKAVKGVVARRMLDDGVHAVDGMEWQGWRVRRDGNHVIVSVSETAPISDRLSRT